MSDIKTLETALAQAKKLYKADKKNAANKKSYKAAKKALEAAQLAAQEAAKKKTKKSKKDKKSKKKRKREAESEVTAEASVEKKAKIDITALESALAQAKAAHKADKSDAGLKKAYKAAKKALAAAKEAESKSTATEETKEETKAPEANPVDDVIDVKSLKKTAQADAPIVDHSNNPVNTSVYCGNLSFSIDEAGIREFFKDCGEINDIHWLTDKDTQDFLGRGFVNFNDLESAAKAVALDQTDCLGRPIRLNYAKARTQNGRTKGGGNSKGSRFVDKPLSERPDNCVTAFLGNVSFDIDDDAIYELAKDCGEIKSIRWLNDRETGDFKGCGFVDFWDSDGVDKFVKLRGQTVMGRPIRIDYSAPRPPRD